MNLHEYQAKSLFRDFGIPVPDGRRAGTPAEAEAVARELSGERWVVKAQIHAGGRGKGGGVRLADSPAEVGHIAGELIGSRLVTPQTDARGLPVNSVLVEQATEIVRELYLGILVDRERERIVVMASAAGGMDIETVAAETPERILKVHVDPAAGLQPYQCRLLAFGLGLEGAQVRSFTHIVTGLFRLFTGKDASLIEINPLIVTGDGELLALDAKINVEDNALWRQPALADMRDTSQEDETERAAAGHGLNYITLDGDIACMVNGAGLAMATMDLIKLHGGEPANFLDVGGGTTAERVAEAFKLILSGDRVRAILVNIFGGIVRCDLIAEGIVAAAAEVGLDIPVVVRLEGTNVERGRKILDGSDLGIITAASLDEAAQQAVSAARGGTA